jgi:N-dimethylarginine dimethylaminohydrolase
MFLSTLILIGPIIIIVYNILLMHKINSKVLMSGADYFTDKDAINILMDSRVPVDVNRAIFEHHSIIDSFKSIGIEVIKVNPPENCQDGIYTANWALIYKNKALMARLPNMRKAEEAYAKKVLAKQGLEVVELPKEIKAFSGQGDSLVVDDMVFCQSPYRTSRAAHRYLSESLGISRVISLETKPARKFIFGPKKINKLTGWSDSPTYDLDLALAILRPKSNDQKALIAYCPAVFKAKSRRLLKKLNSVDKIEVSREEALDAFALNLVSTGKAAVINSGAPKFKADLEAAGLEVIELDLNELKKGGGSIRCSSLTL